MRPVLADASSLILCARVRLVHVLVRHFEVRITSFVGEEISSSCHADGLLLGRMIAEGALRIIEPAEHDFSCVPSSLHGGERSILAAYEEGRGEFIIVDDLAAVRACMKRKIPHVNALLVPKILFHGGCITEEESQESCESLLANGRYSKHVREVAERMSAEGLRFFLPR